MIWLNAHYTYMILNMKIAALYIACSVVLAGILISVTCDQLRAADVAPVKPSAEKSSPEETKKDNPAAKAKDADQQEQIDKLIEQLGDKDYYVRQRAQNELSRLSFDAFDALTAATTNDDLEIASRAKYLLRLMRVEWMAKNDPPEVKEKLKDYEIQPEEARLTRMHDLVVMTDGKGLLALCRLIRFEKSDSLSKKGVIELLQSPSGLEPPKGPRAETIRKLFEKRGRSSASWMLAWIELADDPQAITQWKDLIQTEISLLQRSPGESNREIVSSLIHYQTAWLKKQGQTQEATAAMRRLVELEDNGDLDTLTKLLDWLVEQKAWKLIDELGDRFKSRFESEPMLLYILAQSQKEQGEAAKAEETAHRAFGLNPSREEMNLLNQEMNLLNRYAPLNIMNLYRNRVGGGEEIILYHRYFIAQRFLRRRGLFDWARREFEYVIAQGRPIYITTLNARWSLSEMFHDQGDDMAAANVLDALLKIVDAKTYTDLPAHIASVLQGFYLLRNKSPDKIIEQTIAEVRARKYFLQASHWDAVGDQAKRRECLINALDLEPSDIDVLIACYHLPDQTPEYRKKITDSIRQATEDIRVQIAAEPDNDQYYNEFAWLVANTEGDLDEALKCSQKSLELKPEDGGLYDTLARVYSAKGDYENALKNQRRAAELEPHNGLIIKQLELLKKPAKNTKNRD
jgi:tetratricopeptide (TPR) repeat protein